MATIEQLQDALVNADKAGDIDAARQLADAIVQMRSINAAKPAVVTMGSSLNDVGRQLGLTARHGIQAVGNTVETFAAPFKLATDKLSGVNSKTAGQLATDFSDFVGLPKPQNSTERVVGDITTMGFGTGLTGGTGLAMQKGTGMVREAGKFFSQAPVQQVAGAVGAGAAGGMSREAGGSELQQLGSSILGAFAGVGGASATMKVADKTKAILNQFMRPQEVDIKLEQVLRNSGIDYSVVPEKIKQSLRADLKDALLTGKQLDSAAVARLADFRQAGLTPTRGMLTLDPVQITREKNLAKMAANSGDQSLHVLPRIENQNNAKLIQNLNELGAARGDTGVAGDFVTGAVNMTRDRLRSAEQSAWDAAKSSPGYRQPIAAGVLSDINSALDEQGLMPFMSPTISKYMEAFQSGAPFTPQAYRNLRSMLSNEIAKGGNEGAAARLAVRVLDNADLRPAGVQNPGNLPVTAGTAAGIRSADDAADEAIGAVNRARGATRAAYDYEDSSTLVRSVLSDGASADPYRIAQRFVIGGTRNEAIEVARQVGPNGRNAIKEALVAHLKEKALSGSADEVGKFSQAAFNKALTQLRKSGKLDLFFSPEEIRNLEANARASAYFQFQPAGSAVNNSNSGALIMGKVADWISKLPAGKAVAADALNNWNVSIGNRQATNVLPSLIVKQQSPMYAPFVGPALGAGGLLAAPPRD